jgi:hypothetical protein
MGMSLIKEKLFNKYMQVALFAFLLVLALAFIKIHTFAEILVSGDTVYTNNTKAVIRLTNANVSSDEAFILVPDENHKGNYKVLNSIPYYVQADASGKYITIDIPSKTEPYDYVSSVTNGEQYNVSLAFNLEEDNDIEIASKTNPDGVKVTLVTIEIDTIQPDIASVSISSNNSDKTLAKNGNIITTKFTTTDAVQTPTVNILGKQAVVTGSGVNWTAEYTINSNEAKITEGTVDVSIEIKDLAGNAINKKITNFTDLSSVRYDRTVPKESGVTITSNNKNASYAKNGDKITVTFTTEEDVQEPIVSILGKKATVTGAENTWSAQYTIPTDENTLTEGKVKFSISLTDLAGNKASNITLATDSSSVTYRRTAPMATVVSIASNNSNRAYAKNGDKITITFTTDDTIVNPIVTIFSSTVAATSTGNSWTAEYTIDKNENVLAEGNVPFSISFTDLAGNNVAESKTDTTDKSYVKYDRTVPTATMVSIASSNNLTSYVKNGQKIKLSFATNEAVQTPSVLIFGRSAVVKGNGTDWTAEYVIPDNEKLLEEKKVDFSISFIDLAGNNVISMVTDVTDLTKVTYDRTAPIATSVKLDSSNRNKKRAKKGDKITAAFITSEVVQTPTVTIQGQPASVNGDGSGVTWIAEYTIENKDSGISEGNIKFSIKFKDLSSNDVESDVIAVTDESSINYDCTAPEAPMVSIVSNNGNPIFAKNGDKVTTNFTTNETIQTPTVTIGERVAIVSGSGTSWTAEYTVPADEKTLLEGSLPISITMLDIASNEAVVKAVTDLSKVIYDRTTPIAPTVNIVSNNINSIYAKNGDKITTAFRTSEAIQTPIATILGKAATVTEAESKDGTSWIAEYTIDANEKTITEGQVDFQINFKDLASNNVITIVTAVTDSTKVTYDRTAPIGTSVNLVSNNSNKKHAKKGDKITATFTTSEVVQTPAVVIQGQSASVNGDGSGKSWTAEYTIDKKESNISEGDIKFSIIFKDLSSNDIVSAITTVTDLSSVNYDCTAPLAPVVSVISNNSNPIFAKNGDKVTTNFTTNETIQTPAVTIGERAAVVSGSGTSWTAEYTVPADEKTLLEGSLPISITMLDIASNEAVVKAVTDLSKVTYDRTAPTAPTVNIISNNINPIYAKNGDKITTAFNTNEAVQTPIATILGKVATVTEAGSKDGTSWIAEYTIDANENTITEGQVDLLINFKDLASNNVATTVTTVTDSTKVTYDRTAPTATSVNLVSNNSDKKYAKNGEKITATFATSEVVQMPIVTIQGQPTSVNGDGSGRNWMVEYTILANEGVLTEGNIGFSIFFKDLTSNEVKTLVTATTDNSSVNYDRTTPTASKISVEKVKGTSYSQWVKNEDQFKVKFTLSDTNSGIKLDEVKAQVGGTEFTAPMVTGTQQHGEYEAIFTVDSNTLAGMKDYDSFNYAIKFKDVVGNLGTTVTGNTGINYENVAPEIRYFFNEVNTNSSDLKPYYKNNKLVIQVKEHNFDSTQSTIDSNQIKPTSWVDKGNDVWEMDIVVPDGDDYTFKVNSIDKVGNSNTNDLTSVRPFNMDTTLPVIKYFFNGTQTDTESRYYKTTEQVVIQITEHNFEPANTPVSGNGITTTSWNNKGNDIWEMSLSLGEANDYNLNVSTTDKAENKADKNLGTFTIDITNPVLEIQNIIAGFFKGTLSPRVVYSDKNLDINSVSIKLDGKEQGSGTVAGGGFEKSISIKDDGSYNLVVSLSDLSGNTSTAEIQFVLDNSAPTIGSTTINLKDPIAFKAGWIPQNELKITDANGYDVVTSTLNGVEWDISKPITSEGKNVLYLEVKDKSGNISSLSYQFFMDNTPPKLICDDIVSSKSLDNSGSNLVFISQMKLRLALDKMEIGNEKPDYFTDILLKDKDGNVIEDILHNGTPTIENNLSGYTVPLSKFQTYTLVVNAKDQVGNDINKTYTFTLKDKSIFTKYYENKALFYTSTSMATVIVLMFIALGVMRLNKKKVEIKQ